MPKQPTLEETLADLVSLARDRNSVDVHVKLDRGLHIWVRHYAEKKTFRLCIGRQRVSPSFQEWNIVVSRWPWEVLVTSPVKSNDEHENFFLSAHIPDREVVPSMRVVLAHFPACRFCEYNPCDLANNSDYCPART